MAISVVEKARQLQSRRSRLDCHSYGHTVAGLVRGLGQTKVAHSCVYLLLDDCCVIRTSRLVPSLSCVRYHVFTEPSTLVTRGLGISIG